MFKKQKILRRCWNNHLVDDNKSGKCPVCQGALMEYQYDDNRKLTYDIGNCWADNIIVDFPKGEIDTEKVFIRCHGWKPRIPHKGDYLEIEMTDGNLFLEFVKIDPCGVPTDMFYADLKILFYKYGLQGLKFTPIYEQDVRRELKIETSPEPKTKPRTVALK